MSKNWQMLREVREYIDAHPEDWVQSQWRCDSGMCFAGTAVALDGGVWFSLSASHPDSKMVLAREDDPADHLMSAWYEQGDPVYDENDWYDMAASQRLPIDTVPAAYRAMRILGLDVQESGELFAGHNKRSDIDQILREWALDEDWSEAYDEDAMRSLRKAALI